MRNIKLMCLTIALFALMANDSVLARDGHGHSHLNLGINLGGYFAPGFYGYGGYSRYGYGFDVYGYGYPSYYLPYYVYPPTVMMPLTPHVYTQQQQPQPVQPQNNYWHYCQNPDGYYPYVKSCPGGWLQVAPQPFAQ